MKFNITLAESLCEHILISERTESDIIIFRLFSDLINIYKLIPALIECHLSNSSLNADPNVSITSEQIAVLMKNYISTAIIIAEFQTKTCGSKETGFFKRIQYLLLDNPDAEIIVSLFWFLKEFRNEFIMHPKKYYYETKVVGSPDWQNSSIELLSRDYIMTNGYEIENSDLEKLKSIYLRHNIKINEEDKYVDVFVTKLKILIQKVQYFKDSFDIKTIKTLIDRYGICTPNIDVVMYSICCLTQGSIGRSTN